MLFIHHSPSLHISVSGVPPRCRASGAPAVLCGGVGQIHRVPFCCLRAETPVRNLLWAAAPEAQNAHRSS
jgi:hypothetical protein